MTAAVTIMSQPTNDELSLAWSHAIQCETSSIQGIAGPVLLELKALRDRRTTWFDTDDMDLRRSLDAYLRERGLA